MFAAAVKRMAEECCRGLYAMPRGLPFGLGLDFVGGMVSPELNGQDVTAPSRPPADEEGAGPSVKNLGGRAEEVGFAVAQGGGGRVSVPV